RAPFLRQPPQPVERVAVNEIVRRRVKAVQREIAPSPCEIFFREIEACRFRARPRRANREAAGVSKAVQQSKVRSPRSKVEIGCDVAGQKAPPIVALVQKQTHGIAFVETQLEPDAVLANLKPLRRGFAPYPLR